MSLIQVRDVTIGYDGKQVAEHIQFEVNQGDYLCIIGENGVGKSTLVKTLLGLQKAVSGEIIFQEKGIGYLPQQTVVQKDFPASVWEIVLSGNLSKIGKRPFYSMREKQCALKNMKRMGIMDLKNKCYRKLSGGQQQRVLLARALCASEQILFLDEPVSGLDPKATMELYQLIAQMNESGITIIMVSHDLHAVFEHASHVLHIGKDRTFFGDVQAYKNSEMAKNLATCEQEEVKYA